MKAWSMLASLLAITLLAGGYWAQAQETPNPLPVQGPGLAQPPGLPPQPGAGRPPGYPGGDAVQTGTRLRIKVFRLAVCDPGDVAHLLEELLPEPASATAMPGSGGFGLQGAGFGGAGPGAPGVGAMPLGAGGGAPAGGGFGGGAFGSGFGGGGLGGGLGGSGFGMPNTWRVTVEPRTQAIVVRGSERDVQLAQDLITIVETPDDKPLPSTKHVKAFRLKHVGADTMANVVEELGLEVRVVAAPLAKLLLVAGPEVVLRDVADMVRELDVEAKKGDKPAPPKRLIGGAQ